MISRRYIRDLLPTLFLILAAGCTRAAGPTAPPTPAPTAAPAASATAPTTPPVQPDARLLVPDPTGQLIAQVDQQLRIRNYAGEVVRTPVLTGGPVQWVSWAPRGDQLLAITGETTVECCGLFRDAHYWLVPMTSEAPRELSGLPQEVVLSWAPDQRSLHVLDNWRRPAQLDALGERIQRYDLATGKLTLLLDRTTQLTSVTALSGGDLLVGQYAGGGHGFYYRLPAAGGPLVKAAPFHMRLSPDQRWAVETNLTSQPELAIADIATGQVTNFRPDPRLPQPANDKGFLWLSDPGWAPDSRWLLYTVSTDNAAPAELRFFDRTKVEPDRVLPSAYGAWLPGDGPQALVLRLTGGEVEPWRYDVPAGKLTGPVGPKVSVCGNDSRSCQPVSDVLTSATTAAYLTAGDEGCTLVFLDLTGQIPARVVPVGKQARLLALAADGNTAALGVEAEDGYLTLQLERLR